MTSRNRWAIAMVSSICFFASTTEITAQEKEPIAYIGHGAFFDSKGKQIPVTFEFVKAAQAWYRAKLMAGLGAPQKLEFGKFEKFMTDDKQFAGQERLILDNRSLQWLAANSPNQNDKGRMLGKINALDYALKWKLPERADVDQKVREEFRIAPDLEHRLKLMGLQPSINMGFLKATTNSGQAYINECIAAGVPIPPPIGQMDPAGLTGWKSQGFIPPSEQFIVGTPAEVRTYQDSTGMCVALPRYLDATLSTVSLDGVICLGQTSSAVCFWDNQMNKQNFSFSAGDKIPIGVPDLSIDPSGRYQAGGAELLNGAGGVCTDCHAGQNPYIVHPNSDLGGGLLMGDLNQPPTNLPTFSASRYDPLVASAWPLNQLSHSQSIVPSVCRGCHSAGGSAGAFPHLSSELQGYCGSVLANAIQKTMPPGAGGSQATNPTVIAFREWCEVATSAGPSNRGDPHIETTNGIKYDFQAAGEFVALRNTTSQFELQTRQTPVSTSFVPDPNPYTGLASCVSLNTAVAMRIGKHRVTYQPEDSKSPEKLLLRINGDVVSLPAEGVQLGTWGRLAKADSSGGLDVKITDGTHLIITQNFWASQGYWYLNIDVLNTPAREGIMGHIMSTDWLPLAPGGSSFGPAPTSLQDRHALLNQKFANAWRVTKTTSLFDYSPGTSTVDFTDLDWPAYKPEACVHDDSTLQPTKQVSREEAEKLCRDVPDKVAFEDCVFDVVATGDPGMAKAYVRSLQLRTNAQP